MKFDQLNDLQNFQNNAANLRQLHANKAELSRLRKLLADKANKPKCPHCGGASEQGFERCKNCCQEVIWHGQFVGKPGSLEHLKAMKKAHERALWQKAIDRGEAAKRQEEQARKQEEERRREPFCNRLGKIIFVLSLPLIYYLVYLMVTTG